MAKENGSGCCGCISGVVSLIVVIIVIRFLISFLKNCEGRNAFESAVQTTWEYVNTADSIWNKK